MHPILFHWGPITVRYYGVMYMISFILAIFIARAEIKRRNLGWNFDHVLDLMMYSFIMAILGARIFYVVFSWDYYSQHLADIVAVWKGGLAIHGGLIGAIVGIIIFSRLYNFNKWIVGDIMILGTSLGQVFGRFGNFMNGDAHGIPTTLPWGIVFPHGTPAGEQFPGIPLHPVMLYEMLLNLVTFIVLWRLRKTDHRPGFVAMVYFILYGVFRFGVSFFRADNQMLGVYSIAQILSVVAIVVASGLIFWRQLWKPIPPPV